MSATPQDVQAKIDAVMGELSSIRYDVGQLVSPPPPPPAVFDPDPFIWDASTAPLDANSAALAKEFVTYALPAGAYIAPNIAYTLVKADGSTKTYSVPTAGKPGATCMDAMINVPVGALGSWFNDHHLTIIDRLTGRQHDL